jgi:hypothetical protein
MEATRFAPLTLWIKMNPGKLESEFLVGSQVLNSLLGSGAGNSCCCVESGMEGAYYAIAREEYSPSRQLCITIIIQHSARCAHM